jgi:hypothetical protein
MQPTDDGMEEITVPDDLLARVQALDDLQPGTKLLVAGWPGWRPVLGDPHWRSSIDGVSSIGARA